MRRLGGVLLMVAAVLSACGSPDNGGVIDQSEQSSPAAFNAADVSFAQMMIPHHEQAVEMAELAVDRAESQEVNDLAAEIEAAQAPEIETMRGWLEEWGESVNTGMEGMEGMAGMEGMEGMMSEEQMAALEAASGQAFDELFLTQMREHHEGAVMMAEEELEKGEYPEAKELARTIVDTQRAEIAEIDRLLGA